MDASHGADDVHDRVQRTNLVEVNVFDGRAVDLGLGIRQTSEDRDRSLLHNRRQIGGLDDRANIMQIAVGVMVMMVLVVLMVVPV
jgi:hypothetical protein